MKIVNDYIDHVFQPEDDVLEEVKRSITEHGMPEISVSPSAGKLLTMLVQMNGAEKVLEIGALGGYSGICLARGFGDRGELVSLELKESFAEVARENLKKAGFGSQVSYLTGPALEGMETLQAREERFDFFFIDADKGNYANYLEGCLPIAKSGAIIVADNVLARGSVADESVEPKSYTEDMRKFNQLVADHPELESILIPIGDGLTVSRVKKR
ncbi:O-methyltransferase [Salimicrobium flavidum]|uniref:Predicted O-methyltransferase YrrM n=1 Tax=Salimicrobium flavidum TaxID=570947 RepID=A0A1N7KFF0_9BACI|nr:O-methyltransferase [Salimicrobium flavidum]SIS60295.1 Predicted O-methyltransferase YrrM [Salimicrobium flavidum]